VAQQKDILLLTDRPNGALAEDLDVLYPERVQRLDFTTQPHGPEVLSSFRTVITVVTAGGNVTKLDYGAITEYARAGGQVLSCLFEYAHYRGLHFSKTHVLDRMLPGMRIEAVTDITRGFALGDILWWYGTVSGAPEEMYDNQALQRQVMGVREGDGTTVLGTSTVNGGAVMVEERVGKGRILALDMLSPGRPYFNSKGATNKYLFLANLMGSGVRYGRHYPRRLGYDEFVDLMHETAARYPELTIQAEGPCSDGRQMWSLNLGDPARPTIYLGAAIHGWEWENAYGLLRFAEVISQDRTVEGLNTRHFHYKILPIQNPWGYDHFTRQNAHGVDLNRNFDCGWQPATGGQDVLVPWDYNYNGTRAASERETQIMQGIIDRFRPVALVDFHTADYVMLRGHRGDRDLFDAIQKDVQVRLKDRFLVQRPYGGPYQQVNLDRAVDIGPDQPYLASYAAEKGAAASFLLEMSGNRDDVHALVINTDTVVEICLAVVKQCLARGIG
jgi:hypothetical protein